MAILLKTNLRTPACSHVILFTSDLELSDDKLIDYYSLRFPIEFNFRDPKQFWRCKDFMTVNPTPVTNAANLSFFMVNLSHHLLDQFHAANPPWGLVDLKAYCRSDKYVDETIKLLPQKPEPCQTNDFSERPLFLCLSHSYNISNLIKAG
ncbi:transposase [Microseira wollei NIES-4236]|uniref:Transposase n=1 Tax=Microseira wollei NIES-4236 TaxID=2530354 RepID=A0AAV3XHK2_9CYAN|nr:transposase [Microseira wollei NIES-4236]